jgi:phosphonate transport system substrate-binding protein
MCPIVSSGDDRTPRPPAPISRRRVWLAGAMAVGFSGCRRARDDAAGPGAITFSTPTDERVGHHQSDWRALYADMQQVTGLRVKPFFAPSDAALLAAMKYRRVDAGWFSNQAALAAVRSANGEVFARTLPAGEPRRATLIARTGGATLEAIRRCDHKLSYGAGPANSMAGELAPIAFFFGPEKLEPRRCFRQVAGDDLNANLRAVADGKLDVAASDTALLAIAAGSAPSSLASVTTIWTSPPLPQDPIIWRRDLDPDAKERLRQFFITYARGEGAVAERQRAALTPLDVGGFEVADNNHLLLAREMEARERLALAEWSGDAARTQAARRAVDSVTAERQAFEDRVRAQAGTQ